MDSLDKELLSGTRLDLNRISDLLADALSIANAREERVHRSLKYTEQTETEVEYKHLCQYCQKEISKLEYIMNNIGNKFVFHVCSNKCWAILRVVLEMQGYKFNERDQQIYEGK